VLSGCAWNSWASAAAVDVVPVFEGVSTNISLLAYIFPWCAIQLHTDVVHTVPSDQCPHHPRSPSPRLTHGIEQCLGLWAEADHPANRVIRVHKVAPLP